MTLTKEHSLLYKITSNVLSTNICQVAGTGSVQLYQLLRLSMKINATFALTRVYKCAYFKSTTYGLRILSLYTTKLITYEFVAFSLYSTKLPVGYL